jgi:hypothetical protein
LGLGISSRSIAHWSDFVGAEGLRKLDDSDGAASLLRGQHVFGLIPLVHSLVDPQRTQPLSHPGVIDRFSRVRVFPVLAFVNIAGTVLTAPAPDLLMLEATGSRATGGGM